MKKTGVNWAVGLSWSLLVWFTPLSADDTAEDITDMLSWWDDYGSYWEEASEWMEFTGEYATYSLAENTVESLE